MSTPSVAYPRSQRALASCRSTVYAIMLLGPLATTACAQGASPDPAITQGVELLRAGRSADALKVFEAAVAASPRSSVALTWRGICENQTGAFSAAAKDLRSAVRLDPSSLSAHYNLALSLIRLHETDSAIGELSSVITLQPQAVPARYNLAVLLEEKHEVAKAAEQLRAAHGLAPDDAGISLHLLEDTLQLDEKSLVPELVQALSGSGATPPMRREAGAALVQAGRFAEAATLLQQAREEEPAAAGVTLLLARAYIGEGKNTEATALLDADPSITTDEEMVYTAGLASLGANDLAGAAARFRVAATLDPKDGRPLYHLALLAERSVGGAPKAIDLLKHAVALDRKNPAFTLALARLLLASDEAAEAGTLLQALPASSSDDVERSALLGVSLASTSAIAPAILQLQHALALNPQLALAHSVLGFCFFRQGDYARAAAAYEKASALEPTRLMYARDAALAYERAAEPVAALTYATRAVSLPDAGATDKVLLGKLYLAVGRQNDALPLLRQAVAADPDLDSALYLLARTCQRMGDREQAAEWNAKLQAAKQRHEAAFVQIKRNQAEQVRSSSVLAGGTLTDDETALP